MALIITMSDLYNEDFEKRRFFCFPKTLKIKVFKKQERIMYLKYTN